MHGQKLVGAHSLEEEFALEGAAAAVVVVVLVGMMCDAERSLGAAKSIAAVVVGESVVEEEHIGQVELENLAEEEEDNIDGWFGLVGERMEEEHSAVEGLVGLVDLL